MKLPIVFAGLAFVAAAACAPTATQTAARGAPAGRDCFNTRTVNGYNSVDAKTVRVSVGARDEYDLAISGPNCSNVTWTMRVALTSPSSWICVGDRPGQGHVAFEDSATGPTSCWIDSVTKAPPKPPKPPA
jgi:hypothetical protein